MALCRMSLSLLTFFYVRILVLIRPAEYSGYIVMYGRMIIGIYCGFMGIKEMAYSQRR